MILHQRMANPILYPITNPVIVRIEVHEARDSIHVQQMILNEFME